MNLTYRQYLVLGMTAMTGIVFYSYMSPAKTKTIISAKTYNVEAPYEKLIELDASDPRSKVPETLKYQLEAINNDSDNA